MRTHLSPLQFNGSGIFVCVWQVLQARAQPHTGAQHPHPPPTGRERGQAGT